ncbi:MAG: CDP-alcohol phosphatidyltransferase family protein [Pirellulales bacterium]
MARRISRPLALRVTWVAVGWGLSAHAVTCLAWLCGLAAAAFFSSGSVAGWLAAAFLLQLWYLLDHVDGQLARYHGTASLDGVQLDYLMHHTLNLLIPLGAGCGLAGAAAHPPAFQLWPLLGLIWGLSLLCLGLVSDTRYKAFVQRLKRVRGQLEVIGGGGARPSAPPPIPRRPLPLAAWLARKSCEVHVIMNILTAIALAQWLFVDRVLLIARVYLLLMAPLACLVFVVSLVGSLRRHAAEREFALWYHPPGGSRLIFEDGWWSVRAEEGGMGRRGDGATWTDEASIPAAHLRSLIHEAPETD